MVFRKSYSREFKIEAVKLVTEAGNSQTQVASDLGIHRTPCASGFSSIRSGPRMPFPAKGIN